MLLKGITQCKLSTHRITIVPPTGTAETANGCCNTCDEVIESYKKKRWWSDLLVDAAKQCIQEGRDKSEMKELRHGEGCNIAGHFSWFDSLFFSSRKDATSPTRHSILR